MKTSNRYELMFATILVLGLTLIVGDRAASRPIVGRTAADLPRVRTKARLVNGVNLTRPNDPRAYILKTVRESLKPADRSRAFEIARVVIKEANRQNLDPLLVLAVIRTESSFDLNARGLHGEIGLMQVMPATAAWLTRETKLDLTNPAVNIRVGAQYLAHLRERFPKHTHRFVAAYNMGAHNVRRLVASRTEPKIYAGRVLGNYRDMTAGLKRQTIHQARRLAAQNM